MSISSVDSGPLHVRPSIDLNLATEANRILFVINKVIERAKFAGVLQPLIKNEGLLLRDVLDANSLFTVIQACEKYTYSKLNQLESSESSANSSWSSGDKSSKDSTTSDKEKRIFEGRGADDDDDDDNDDEDSADTVDEDEEVTGPRKSFPSPISSTGTLHKKSDRRQRERCHGPLVKVIYLLEENHQVQELARNMENQLTPQMKFFLKCLTEFKNRMTIRLHENAAQYKTREKYMRETYEKNERAKKEIEKLEEALVVTKTDANVCLIGRNILINRHQNKIEKIQQNSQEAIEKRIKESEKGMVNDWQTSMIEQERLKVDLQQASEKYSNLLRDHLAAEKSLRAKRTKVENQVLGWIQKFDLEIGEKQAEEEEIQALLDKETSEVNEIQKKLDEQEEEYDELMQEKAAFEEEMLERRLYQFIVNRSARRIQRTYRLYKARKLAKKLAKKGKKGKKKSK